MSKATRILAAIVLAALSVGPVSAATVTGVPATTLAQNASGTVQGTVQDETGAPISGATITVRGTNTYTATTDATGNFTVSGIGAGLYAVDVRKAGYDSATESDLAVASGVTQTVAVRLHSATLTTLRTIATVRAAGRGVFNTTTAAVTNVDPQVFQDQAQPQVTRVLNQVPGVQISLPQSSANGAAPGAITFPNVRGGLSFETASLIDGHPLAVGLYGDYVTTFLSSYVLGTTEVIKGPGAMSPQVNYAINGTVNFRTKEPTRTMTPDYTYGVDNRGGSFFNLGVSDTVLNGRLGFVFDVANTNTPGALNNYQATFVPSGGFVNQGGTVRQLTYNDTPSTIPGTSTQTYSNYGLVACCLNLPGNYDSTAEFVKLRYKFSDATTATASYLGSQTYADQNVNTGSQNMGVFTPSINPGTYTGPIAAGSPLLVNNLFPVNNREVNNEPILQAEVRSTLGNDTVLARFYHAGIQRIKREGNDDPTMPTTVNLTLNGIDKFAGAFNGQSVPVQFFDYYMNPEIDSLNGISFQYSHPIGENDVTFSYDSTRSTTIAYSQGVSTNSNGTFKAMATPSVSVPSGSSQNFQTLMLRGNVFINPKLNGTISLYDNLYSSTYAIACGSTTTPVACTFDPNANPLNAIFTTQKTSHFDGRVALEYRPKNNLAIRLAAGSSIAPPYLGLLTQINQGISYRAGSTTATQRIPNPNVVPETAFGFNLGADLRLKDNVTFLTADAYSTTLFNQFIGSYSYFNGATCSAAGNPGSGCPAAGVPLVFSSSTNLTNARYQGIELGVKRVVPAGLGFSLSGALQRAYAYNLPANFHCTFAVTAATPCNPSTYNAMLGIVPDINYTGGVPSSSNGYSGTSGFGGVSNQNIPYLQGNLSLNYTMKNGAFLEFGDTLYGKNNSLNEPPFAIAYATVRYPLAKTLSLQVSGDNIFNAYTGLFPIAGNGVAIPLANGTLGATSAGVLGPATYRFVITKTLGAFSENTNP